MTDAHAPNAEQHDYWNGREAKHWIAYLDQYDASLDGFGAHVLDAAALVAADNVVDVGCGCGATTLDAARRASLGDTLGVDLSGPMLDIGRRRAADQGVANARFEQADAQTHTFPSGFDVAISRFGVMFFDDPVRAFANIGRALRPGGRLPFVCWQDLLANEWLAVPAGAALNHVPMPDLGQPGAPGPFAFADPDRIRDVLGGGGFEAIAIDAVHEPLTFGATVDDAMTFLADTEIAQDVFEKAEPAAVEHALAAIRDALSPYASADGVQLGGAAWLVTARHP